MADKELLELAALTWFKDKAEWVRHCCRSNENDSRRWNPLTDDGDALRLVVKLGLDINCYSKTGETSACLFMDGIWHRCIERTGQDPYAATRRAIVRAAAEIGKELK